jgi:hypothetical protein
MIQLFTELHKSESQLNVLGGTRYVANMRLTLELLRGIYDTEESIVRVTGDYTGNVMGR